MRYNKILHIIGGDCAGASLAKSGMPGEVFVWHDILYDGPRRKPGWPDEETIKARAKFLDLETGGGLSEAVILVTVRNQYRKLAAVVEYERVVLWFDACLFDQAMLAHILACLKSMAANNVELLVVDAFPGIEPYHGLGQMMPEQLASVHDRRRPVSDEQFCFAERVDRAFALQDRAEFDKLAALTAASLEWVPAAVKRWIQEQPDEKTGLGRLEQLALAAIRAGHETPAAIFTYSAAHDTPPQFWGDTMLWAKINGLAGRQPPLVKIKGPKNMLPQWEGQGDLNLFRVYPVLLQQNRD